MLIAAAGGNVVFRSVWNDLRSHLAVAMAWSHPLKWSTLSYFCSQGDSGGGQHNPGTNWPTHSNDDIDAADEFIRRFLLHTLPDGFHRIRHYGFLANGHRAAKLALCHRLLDMPHPEPAADPIDNALSPHRPERCPCCGGVMMVISFLPRPMPARPSFWHDTS